MLLVVDPGGGEVFLEGGVGGVPDHAELLELFGPFPVQLFGSVGAALFCDPLAEVVGAGGFPVAVGDACVVLAFGVAAQRGVAAGPVLAFGVDDVEGDSLGDHDRVPGGGKTQQQT
ncbi:hypothetical protein AAW14_37020 [Streptomyces hygroscopicus]|nr:hypothetical protein [Streptomyces hygroscopicus]